MKREHFWKSLTVAGFAAAAILGQGCNGGNQQNSNGNQPDSTQGSTVTELPIDSNKVVFTGDTVEGMVRFKTEANLYGFYNDKGETVLKPKYSVAFDFKDGWAKVGINGKQGFIDKTGAETIPPTYDKLTTFNEDRAGALIDGKWGFIDRANKLAIPAQYVEIQTFSEGVCPVKVDTSTYWTYIDTKGKTVIGESMKLEAAWPFSEGLAHGMKENLWGFFNHSGKVVIPFEYFNVGPFEEGSAPAQKPEFWIRIDKKGKCVMNCDGKMEGAEVSGGGHDHEHGEEGHSHEGHEH